MTAAVLFRPEHPEYREFCPEHPEHRESTMTFGDDAGRTAVADTAPQARRPRLLSGVSL